VRHALIATLILTTAVLVAQVPGEFEVASIKRNTSADSSSSARSEPTGRQVMTNVSARMLVSQAFPSRGSNQIVGLPSWAESERYDVTVKTDRRRPRDEQIPMWRALLTDRMKLTAHYEAREEPTYDLVFARPDHRLGPQLKPTSCVPLSAPADDKRPRCGFSVNADRIAIGPVTTAALANALRLTAGRLVTDKTGLQGSFDVELSFRPAELGNSPNPNDAPDFFTAVQEQLGLKLVGSTGSVEVLVIDHIEHPAEN